MNKISTYLGTLLILQLLLAGGLFASSWQAEHQNQRRQPILSFDPSTADRVTIESSSESVDLRKSADGWRLPDDESAPVDPEMVRNLLATLGTLEVGLPVATSPASQEQFAVGEKTFERKVKLYRGEETLGTLIVGTSQGLGRSYLRAGESSNIYVAALSLHQLPTESESWMEPKDEVPEADSGETAPPEDPEGP